MNYYLTEGLEGVEHCEYRNIRSLKRAVDPRLDGFRSSKADENQTPKHLVFAPVTLHQLTNIERVRDAHYKALRFLYFNQEKTLIIKIIPGPVHQMVTNEFVYAMRERIVAKGQGAEVSSTIQGWRAKRKRMEPSDHGWPVGASWIGQQW